ncbi:MAG: FAD-dependent thymidylate synthase, partial [Verrucomicrobia bacterium]|nr:FAD-dependent thymidylate synthase [Verrucomicrobiota bacterium]
MNEFLSTPPEIKLVNAFDSPLNNAVAAAKTCYSSRGVVYGNDVVAPDNGGADSRETRIRKRDNLARSLYKAGHHTVFQHAHFQFSISNVSRFFVWSFLHSHPFYNSEQVSQRYVEVRNNSYAVPPMPEPAYQIYDEIIQLQFNAYHRLIDALEPCVRNEYYSIFKGRRPQNDSSADSKAIKKKCMEIARYVLPISTFTHLYHTISLITLMRYHRLMNIFDTTMEQRLVVGKMIEAVLEFAPELELLFEESIPLEFTPEFRFMEQLNNHRDPEFIKEFDASLDGRTSKLISRAGDNEGLLAGAVREIFGISEKRMDDRNAIESVLNPASNTWLGEAMNVTHYTKICRAMEHPVYTFRKKLSHTADSQNQRHRTTPASRPCLTASIADEPDYITPAVIKEHDPARKLYEQIMETTWDGINRL